jgi:hypothetical protein
MIEYYNILLHCARLAVSIYVQLSPTHTTCFGLIGHHQVYQLVSHYKCLA